jgi:hypothetical protein
MITTGVQYLKKIHERLGYPLGKVQYKTQMIMEKLQESGSPLRHVRRIAYKTMNPGEILRRKMHARNFTRNLKPGIAACARELGEKGFTYFTEEVDPQLLQELNTYYDDVISKRSATAKPQPTHPFFFSLSNPEEHTTDNVLVRFALQDSILQAVTAYFGCVPLISGIHVTESRSVTIDSERMRASQQWHMDYSAGGDDEVSVWVHMTDVNSLEQGPFTYIPIPGSRKVKNDFFPRRIRDEEIVGAGLAGEVKHAFGPRSTVFIMNSLKIYHMGSRLAPGNKRVVCIFTYVKPGKYKDFVKITTPVPQSKRMLICR